MSKVTKTLIGTLFLLCLFLFPVNAAEDPYAVNPIGCGNEADKKIEKFLIESTSIDCIVESVGAQTMRIILHKSHGEKHADQFLEVIKKSMVLKYMKEKAYTDLKIYYNDSHVKTTLVRKL
jgi:hypothetical protein